MPCPRCGDSCMCAPAPSYSGASAEARLPVRDGTETFALGFLNRGDSAAPASQSPTQYQRIQTSQVAVAEMPEQDFDRAPGSSVWRDKVSSRVQAHRAKRKRRFDPEASLSLGFEP